MTPTNAVPAIVGVMGANGFIGRHLVRRLATSGMRVVAFGRDFPENYRQIVGAEVETRLIDFTRTLETHALLQDVSTVVQLINSSAPGMANNRVTSDLTVNVLPHIDCIESCMMAGVKSYIFLSSGGTVYGHAQYLPIDEDHPRRPLNSYGMTKMVVEQYLEMLTNRGPMGYTSLRVSNPYGPGQYNRRGQGLVPAILKNQSLGVPVTVFGDGKSERDYIYIDDLIDGIVAAIQRPPLRSAVNVGSGKGRSILDVIAAIERATGKNIGVMFAAARATDAKSNILDPRKAAELLDWTARTDFAEGINRTVAAWAG